jgi:hypothetical protein
MVLVGVLPLVLLPAWMVSLPADTCAGVGLAAHPGHIDCDGGCEAVPDAHCKERAGSDSTGTYYFCSCTGTEPSCCHLIVRKVESVNTLFVKGLCTFTNPACASSDGLECKKTPTTNQPACLPIPPG